MFRAHCSFSRILILAAVVLPLSDRFAARANAEIINDSVITGRVLAEFDTSFSANGELDVTHSETPPRFWHLEAQSTTLGNKIRQTSFGAGFGTIIVGVVDVYTVTGGTPGEQISFNGHYRVVGNSQHIDISSFAPIQFSGGVIVGGAVGFGLDADGVITGGNPVITDVGGLGKVFGQAIPFNTTTTFMNVDFDFDVVIPLTVTVGEQFQLSFSNSVVHTNAVLTDMFDTASVSFDLPAGMSITSTKGFGTTPIPEPSTLTLAGFGLIGLLVAGRASRKRPRRRA